MGLTHVAMRKLGFLFDIPCGVFYVSLFRETQGCNKCLVLRGNVRSSFQVDFAAAAKGEGEREVEEKRGRGSKARQLRPPTFQASSSQPESHFAQPCHTLSAVCCSTGISSQATGWRRAGPALGLGTHHHPPSSPPPPPPPLDSTKARFSDRQLATEAAHSRFPPNVSPDLLLPIHCFVPSLSKVERCNLKLL